MEITATRQEMKFAVDSIILAHVSSAAYNGLVVVREFCICVLELCGLEKP